MYRFGDIRINPIRSKYEQLIATSEGKKQVTDVLHEGKKRADVLGQAQFELLKEKLMNF